MATLFERIIGGGGEGVSAIPIHSIKALFGEISRGEATPQDIVEIYGLDEEQQAGLMTFLTKLAEHPDKVYLGLIMFDWLALAERGVMPEKYRNEEQFWVRIDAEIQKAAG